MKKLTAIVAAVMVAFAAPSFAETTEFYIGAGATKPSYDSFTVNTVRYSLDGDVGHNIAVGLHTTFDNNFVLGVELGRAAADAELDGTIAGMTTNATIDTDVLYLGALFGYKFADRITPYFRLGYARVDYKGTVSVAGNRTISLSDDTGTWFGIGLMGEVFKHDNITLGLRGDISRFSSDSRWATVDVFLKFAF